VRLKPSLAYLNILMTLVYLGLAILGRGGFVAFFSLSPLIVLAIAFFAISVISFFSGGNLSPGVREDRANRWVIPTLALLGLLMCYLAPYTDRREFWALDGNLVRWLGVVLFTSGAALRLWPVFVLGRRFSGLVAIQPGHELVTNGIYGVVRNPSYLGLLIGSLGWSLAFRSFVGVLLTALMIPPLFARMRSEEALLHSQFGSDYDEYRARTPRLIPSFKWWRKRT